MERAEKIQEGQIRRTGYMEDPRFRGSWSGNERDAFFLNPKGPRFVEMAYSLGLDFPDDGRAVVPVDFDGDGDLDLAIHALQGLRLVENRLPPKSFARVRLEAVRGDRQALGALVRLEAGGVTQQDYVKATTGLAAQVPLDLHFGLGGATQVDRLSIRWPDRSEETLRDLPANRLLVIRQGTGQAEPRVLPRWPVETRPRILPQVSLKVETERLEGGRAPLADRPGVPVVVHFSSPDETSSLQELGSTAQHARVVGVWIPNGPIEEARTAARDLKLPFPQFLADPELIQKFFGREAKPTLPATFLFDDEGRLRRAFHRPVSSTEVQSFLDSFGRGQFHVDYLIEGIGERTRGNLEAAARKIEHAIATYPRYALGHLQLGLVRVQQRRLPDAIDCFHRAIEIEPHYVAALHNLGLALLDSGRREEAERTLRRALEIDDRPGLRVALGQVLREAGRHDEAEQTLKEALRMDPGLVRAYVELGALYKQMGRDREAEPLLKRAAELDPKNPDAARLLQMPLR